MMEKKTDLKDAALFENSRESRLYQSEFWKQLTSLVEKYIHKILSIDYIQ